MANEHPQDTERVDFEAESAEPASGRLPPGPSLGGKYDPSQDREKARGLIAQALILILATIVLFAFITLWASRAIVKPEDLKDVVSVLLGAVAALVGSATGFYFGGKTNGQQ